MTAVIDAPVLLAAILGEPGGDFLDAPNELFHLSVINLAEVYTKAIEFGGSIEDVDAFIQPLSIPHQRVPRWSSSGGGALEADDETSWFGIGRSRLYRLG